MSICGGTMVLTQEFGPVENWRCPRCGNLIQRDKFKNEPWPTTCITQGLPTWVLKLGRDHGDRLRNAAPNWSHSDIDEALAVAIFETRLATLDEALAVVRAESLEEKPDNAGDEGYMAALADAVLAIKKLKTVGPK